MLSLSVNLSMKEIFITDLLNQPIVLAAVFLGFHALMADALA